MSDEGALQFARYAYPPNELGYCGPDGAHEMLVPGAVAEIERRARLFDGAWVYLEFLAGVLGTDDPLSTPVVEAYWIGTDLLDAVDPAALVDHLRTAFDGQVGGTWRESAARARAHHSYQVFEVYPWAAMLLRGLPPGPAVSVLDRCRIRPGVVSEVHGEWAVVTSSLLTWDGDSLTPSSPRVEDARWAVDGHSLLSPPAVGDTVALHWDWVCDVLTPTQADRIQRIESDQRSAVGLGGSGEAPLGASMTATDTSAVRPAAIPSRLGVLESGCLVTPWSAPAPRVGADVVDDLLEVEPGPGDVVAQHGHGAGRS
ncbi:MAG: DUF6390 family protein [Nocardioides sp.]